MLKVVKFGGSSLAEASRYENVKNIVLADDSRRAVVVSAPGKRNSADNKITDLLYLCHAHVQYGVDYRNILDLIKSRYAEIADGLNANFDAEAEFAAIEEKLVNGADKEFLVSRGEYLSARIMAAHLGFDFVDSYGHVFFNYDKSINREKTYAAFKEAFEKSSGKIVVPGFYGTMPDGSLALMSRGGSDITGSLLAAALNADKYENWTDVPGILMADPALVENPYPIPNISYDELRELTYMGAKVLHEASVSPVRDAGIPVVIKDTGNPEAPGTLIAEKFEESESDRDKFYITGIAGRKGFSVVDVHYEDLAHNPEVLRQALKILENHNLVIDQLSTGVDGFNFLVPTDSVKSHIYAIIAEFEEKFGKGCITVTDNIALVACVSRLMACRPGISGSLFSALGKNDISIRTISQGASELNIIIGVSNDDYKKAVQVLYDRFTKRG